MELKLRKVTVRDDMLREAQAAFKAASPGNIELSDADTLHAGLASLIGQCQGKLVSADRATAEIHLAFARGLAAVYEAMGLEVESVTAGPDGFTVNTEDEPATPVPYAFEQAFEESTE